MISRSKKPLSRDSTAALFDYHRNYLQILSRLRPKRAPRIRSRCG